MKKKFETTDIEQYFQVTNNIAPIYNEEKVHQMITSPKAMSRLKGKPRNLLKFTIMTTLFAVIISAVFMWPSNNLEIPKDKNQIPIPMASIGTKDTEIQSSEPNEASSKADADFQQSQLPLKETKAEMQGTGNPSLQLNAENNTIVYPIGDENRKADEGKKVNFDSIQPIEGSRFILKLSDEELKEIGFQITDTSISYFNKLGVDCLIFFYRIHTRMVNGDTINSGSSEAYLHQTYESPKKEFNDPKYLNILKQNPFPNSTEVGKLDFYPVCQTNTFLTGFKGITGYVASDFHAMNDTLLPVYIPISKINPEKQDVILWFKTNDELLSILSKNHKSTIDLFRKYNAAKQVHKDIDLIVFQAPLLIDESKIIDLSKSELKNLGFQFHTDSTIFRGGMRTEKIELNLLKNGSTFLKTYYADSISSLWSDGCLPVLVTQPDGNPLIKVIDWRSKILSKEMKYEQQFQFFIPVFLKASESFLNEDVIFWFYPTDELFKALPTKIGKALLEEYNYVVAEDKSALEKPECNYFEECKNTLKVSSFKVYPNPANNQATVSFTLPEAIYGRITLIDLMGRERQVLQPYTNYAKGSHRFEVDLSNVPEGIYLIALYSSKGIQTQRLIVAK